MDSISWDSLTGAFSHGSAGWYGFAQRVFALFALTAGPACCFVDAPFGRFPGSSRLVVNGNWGWLIMEIVSPISFCYALASPISSAAPFPSIPTLSHLTATFLALPIARRVLASLFLVHYLNRSIISTFRNPGRAPMHISVPLAAIFFNILNGSLQGFFIGGGIGTAGTSGWGLNDNAWAAPLFGVGVTLWAGGFVSNIICDEILYTIKRSRPTPPPGATPKERYAIPTGFLYSSPFGGVSHPAYSTEWVEWTGYCLATFALAPSLFPAEVLAGAAPGQFWMTIFPPPKGAMLVRVPKGLWPLQGWALQPPALFLLNEVSAMLPRAYSGHQWYKRTFGKDWPKERKILIPGVF
ncbi:hypothetical protein RQP46_008383 [Phenoliferia psychrophenolica]